MHACTHTYLRKFTRINARCSALQPVQDLFNLSTALTANLHELLELVKGLANKVLAPAAAASAAAKQMLPELAGELGVKVVQDSPLCTARHVCLN